MREGGGERKNFDVDSEKPSDAGKFFDESVKKSFYRAFITNLYKI